MSVNGSGYYACAFACTWDRVSSLCTTYVHVLHKTLVCSPIASVCVMMCPINHYTYRIIRRWTAVEGPFGKAVLAQAVCTDSVTKPARPGMMWNGISVSHTPGK